MVSGDATQTRVSVTITFSPTPSSACTAACLQQGDATKTRSLKFLEIQPVDGSNRGSAITKIGNGEGVRTLGVLRSMHPPAQHVRLDRTSHLSVRIDVIDGVEFGVFRAASILSVLADHSARYFSRIAVLLATKASTPACIIEPNRQSPANTERCQPALNYRRPSGLNGTTSIYPFCAESMPGRFHISFAMFAS